MKKVELWGYTIFENGKIIGLSGKELSNNKQISIKWGKQKKKRVVNYARFVYYAFNFKNFNFNDRTIIIQHINGEEKDCSINNLRPFKIKMIKQGENSSSAKLTDKEVEEIKEIYLKSKENSLQKNDPTTKISYRKLAEMYGVSHTTIEGIIKGVVRLERLNLKMKNRITEGELSSLHCHLIVKDFLRIVHFRKP